jgi:hypothetical protein
MTRYEIKPLGIGGILDQAVAVVKDHFVLLVGIAAILYVPLGLLNGLLMAELLPKPPGMFAGMEERALFQEAFLSNAMIFIPLSIVIAFVSPPLTYGAMVWSIASAYLGEPMSVSAACRHAMRRSLSLVGGNLLYGLLVGVGTVLCLVPGVVFGIWFLFYGQGIMLEGLGVGQSMARSKELVKGNMGVGFVLGLLLVVISIAINLVGSIIPQLHVAYAAQVFFQSIVLMLTTAAATVFYFSCRCNAEDFDLLRLAAAVDAENDGDSAPNRDATF